MILFFFFFLLSFYKGEVGESLCINTMISTPVSVARTERTEDLRTVPSSMEGTVIAVEEGMWEKRIHFHIETLVFFGQEEDCVPSGWNYLSAAVLQYNYDSEGDGVLVSM